MSYVALKKIFLSILVLYFLVGVVAEVTSSGDFYPVFSWQLFSRIPSQVMTHTIEIHALGDELFDPPIPFSESKFLFETIGQSPTDYERPIADLVQAIRNVKPSDITTQRNIIENVFPTDTYRYSVIEIEYDSIEYWEDGSYVVTDVLATYENN